MGYRRIRIDEKPLTVDLAREFSLMPALRGEREFKESHAKFLLEKVRSGEFADPIWAKCFVKNGDPNQWFRANGQHSSRILSNLPAGVAFPARLDGSPQNAVIESYELDDISDAAKLFDKFDNPKSVRSNVDYLQQARAGWPELAIIPSPLLARLCAGIDAWKSAERREAARSNNTKASRGKNVRRAIGSRYRGELYLSDPENRQFVLWLAQFATAVNGRFLGRPAITAEIYGSWKSPNREIAEEFWGMVLQETGDDPEDETRELARTLVKAMERHSVNKILTTRTRTVWRRYLKAHVRIQLRSSSTLPTQQGEEQPSLL